MTRLLLPAVIALTLLPLTGCVNNPPADPLVVIAGPKAFSSFEVRDIDELVIWRVVTDEPAPVEALFYGEMPAGFRQELPADHRKPRPLMVGELLFMESVTPLRIFHHEGYVTDGGRLATEHWEMQLRNPPTPLKLDDEPATP
jgi:hypothetical protein